MGFLLPARPLERSGARCAPPELRGRFILEGAVRRPVGEGGVLTDRYSDLFRQRSFPAFLSAGALQFAAPAAVSIVLFYSVTIAYPVSLRETYGALALAFLGLSSALPTFATAFFSGAIADRSDRAQLMRAANLIGLTGVAVLVAILLFRPETRLGAPGGFYLPEWVALVYPTWAAVVVSSTLFRPAFNTAMVRIVPRGLLGRANGLVYAVAGGVTAAMVLAAGILLTVSVAALALGLPFLLYFVTQVALATVSVDLSAAPRQGPARSLVHDARAGFGYIGRHRAILELTLTGLVINFLVALATVELALYVTTWLGATQGVWYGAMVATATVGSSVGFALAGRLRFEARAGLWMLLLTTALGAVLFVLALIRDVWIALPTIFVFGIVPGMFTTIFLSTIQSTVAEEMMGRVFSADEVGSYALVPIGQWAGGSLTYAVGVQGTYLTAGGTLASFGLFTLAGFGALRRLAIRPPPTTPPEPE